MIYHLMSKKHLLIDYYVYVLMVHTLYNECVGWGGGVVGVGQENNTNMYLLI